MKGIKISKALLGGIAKIKQYEEYFPNEVRDMVRLDFLTKIVMGILFAIGAGTIFLWIFIFRF